MRRSILLKLMGIGLLLPITAFAGGTNSIGDAALNLLDTTELITKLMHLACYIIGVALILGSVAQYKNHQQNPKLVPLSTPAVLLLLGVIAVLLPYGTKIFGETYSAEEQNKGASKKENVLPLPDTTRRKPSLLPLPKNNTEQHSTEPQPGGTPGQSAYPQDSYQENNQDSGYPPATGGWTTDPRYNQ